MRIRTSTHTRRRAAALVEFAMVAPIVFMVLFGMIEWCRYIMACNVAENAVREGARYALARTDTLQTNINTSDIQTYVKNYLLTSGSSVTSPVVTVYKCNVFGNPMDANDNIVSSSSSAATFDQTQFGDYICVTLVGVYKPALPNFLKMNGITQVAATCIECSEGN